MVEEGVQGNSWRWVSMGAHGEYYKRVSQIEMSIVHVVASILFVFGNFVGAAVNF